MSRLIPDRSRVSRTVFGLFLSLFFISSFNLALAESEPRTILAIYDSSEDYNKREDNNLIHNNAEMPLNYLGLRVIYHDIQKGLPSEETMKGVRGILTWFQDEELPGALNYCDWAIGQVQAGKRYVVFDFPGFHRDSETQQPIPPGCVESFYRELGILALGEWTDNPLVIELVEKDSKMVEFERPLDNELGVYEKFEPVSKKNKVYLTIRRADIKNSESSVVMTTPKGGLVFQSYAILLNYINDRVRWRINPFDFFKEAFDVADLPKFDTTTLFGRRIFYTHIDGDGLRNLSEIDNTKFSGELLFEEVLLKYIYPATVSFITSEIDSNYFGNERLLNLAKEIAVLDHVELGAHGFSHPLYWDKKIVSFDIEGYSRQEWFSLGERKTRASDTGYYDDYSEKGFRVKVDDAEYLKRETQGAIEFINEYVAPEGKQVTVYQWTGDCEPPAAAIDLVDEVGVLNINYGDTRLDRYHPTYTTVASLVRQVDGRIQVHTSGANENIYTDGWEAPFDRFAHVIETFQQTEYPTLIDNVPRRVAPMNVYYHFYMAEKKMALPSLQEIFDYIDRQAVIPLFTSQYIQIVLDFLKADMVAISENGWRFSNYGENRTVRLDSTDLYPDITKSSNILGFKRWENATYIHLAKASNAELHLTKTKPSSPYLEEASTLIEEMSISNNSILFKTRIYREGYYRFMNMGTGSTFRMELRDLKDSEKVLTREVKANANGRLEVTIPDSGLFEVHIYKV